MRLARVATAIAVAWASMGPSDAAAQGGPTAAMDDRWHFTIAPYFWMTGIEGEATVADALTVPVDASFSDLLENFDIGLQGHLEARRNRLGFILDFTWTNLGVPVTDAQLLGANADVRQLVTEGVAFYRVARGGREDNPAHLDVLAGVRYSDTKTQLTLASGSSRPQRDVSWVDALGGLKFRAPLGSRAAILGRGDLAGLGSELTWNVEGDLAFRAAERWTVGAGWRHMDLEYENEESLARTVLDLAYDGPRIWVAYSW